MNGEPEEPTGIAEPVSPYAGRWVARVEGRLIAQGGTPQQALRSAQATRFKERPSVTYVQTARPLLFSKILDRIAGIIPEDEPVYLVGGAIRDALLQKEAHDLDFCMQNDPKPLARKVANAIGGSFYVLDGERRTARVVYSSPEGGRYSIDFASFRGRDLEADLQGRDFTINAMAVDIHANQRLLDPLGGAQDVKDRQVRACSPDSILEDPLRILRGIRLAADLTFHIVPETRQLMKNSIESLVKVSAERKRDELFRILDGKDPATALRALDWLGCSPYLFPELDYLKGVSQSEPHVHNVWEHSLAVVRQLHLLLDVLVFQENPGGGSNLTMGQAVLYLGRYRERLLEHFDQRLNPNRSLKALLMLIALYHDIAKPVTREIESNGKIRNLGHEKLGAEAAVRRAQALQLSNLESDRLRDIIRYHMRIHSLVQTHKPPTPKAIYRFFRDAGDSGVDLCLLALADTLATYETTLPEDTWTAYLEICRLLLESYWENPTRVVDPPGLVNGHDLQTELKISPGPRLGLLLEAIREAQAEGQIHNRDEALRFGREWIKQERKPGNGNQDRSNQPLL